MHSIRTYIQPWLIGSTVFSNGVQAQPSFQSSFVISGQKVYHDVKNTNLYYHIPPDYKLVSEADGKPAFTLTQMRYTGTKTTGDVGKIKFHNILQFRIATDPEQVKIYPTMRAELRKTNPSAELRMLPVRRFSSVLVFASSSDTAFATDTSTLKKVDLANVTDESAGINNSFFTERIVSLRLTDFDAQLVASALEKNQSIMSFSYAFFTVFSEKKNQDISMVDSKKIRPRVRYFFQEQISLPEDTTTHLSLIKADVVDLSIDLSKWPTTIQKVDINERVPARYALFDVYCYDFANDLRADLFEKKIEIKASSVNGTYVINTFTFKAILPEIYARSIRIPYAVRLDLPFYYRVTEFDQNGDIQQTEWIEKKDWYEILDITSPPEKFVRPKTVDQ